jgi:hypothetical protein
LKAVVDHALDFFHFLMPISEIARASSDTSTSFSSLSSSALYKTSLVLPFIFAAGARFLTLSFASHRLRFKFHLRRDTFTL